MIWEEMSYNKLSDCFSFMENLEYDGQEKKKVKNRKIQKEQEQEQNTEEAKEEK